MRASQAITDLRKPGKAYVQAQLSGMYPPVWVEVVKSDLISKLKRMPNVSVTIHFDNVEPRP